jgi:hypothetical protein
MLNCYCQLSSSVIFRQIVLANQNAKLTGPDQGFLVSRLVLTMKPWERGWSNVCVLMTRLIVDPVQFFDYL